jgi:predicted aldo/keto reductase-like oxidoreductase
MNDQNRISRRQFLAQATLGAAGLPALWAAAGQQPAGKRTATDLVQLGTSDVKVCRLAMGTGSQGGRVQRQLGQEKFTALLRHGFDQGLSFIDTADNYRDLHEMIRAAIKGLEREKLQIMCKIWPGRDPDPLKAIDRFRQEVGAEYFDVMLVHCARTGDWVEKFKPLRDALDTAKAKGIIRATGVSMHGLAPLRATVATDWGDVRLVRVNHKGSFMDGPTGKWSEPGAVEEVVQSMRTMHAKGKGVLGMKLIGNGSFKDPEVRRQSIDFVMKLDCVDAVTIGFKSPGEIDEAIANINRSLAEA